MKSGNSFILDEILEWEVKDGLRGLAYMRLKFTEDAKTTPIYASVQLEQIEFILKEKY
jgi:hypothetical protein